MNAPRAAWSGGVTAGNPGAGGRQGLSFRGQQAWRIYVNTELGNPHTLRDLVQRWVEDLGMRGPICYRRHLDAPGWRFERKEDRHMK